MDALFAGRGTVVAPGCRQRKARAGSKFGSLGRRVSARNDVEVGATLLHILIDPHVVP